MTKSIIANVTPAFKDQVDRARRERGLDTEATYFRGLVERDMARGAPRMTAGDWFYDLARASLAPYNRRDEEVARVLQRASITTADDSGLVPTYIVGDLLNTVDAHRYVVNSMRRLPMPAGGKTFTRPRVTTRSLSGVQANELDELAGRKLLAPTGATITKHTHGGVLGYSEQLLDWSDPALMEQEIGDLAIGYAISTESEAALAIEAAVTHGTNDGSTSLTAVGSVFHAAVAAAALSVYQACKMPADTIYLAVDRWAYMVGLVDLQGRPMYPASDPPLGLNLVVSPGFRQGFIAVGASFYTECYEDVKGFVRAVLPQIPAGVPAGSAPIPVDPTTLEFQIPFRGYFTTSVQPLAIHALGELVGGVWTA